MIHADAALITYDKNFVIQLSIGALSLCHNIHVNGTDLV